jgi:hypothetical protein
MLMMIRRHVISGDWAFHGEWNEMLESPLTTGILSGFRL